MVLNSKTSSTVNRVQTVLILKAVTVRMTTQVNPNLKCQHRSHVSIYLVSF